MKNTFNLDLLGISPKKLFRNLCTAQLYAQALRYDAGAVISDKGALVLMSGEKTSKTVLFSMNYKRLNNKTNTFENRTRVIKLKK